MSLNGKAQIQIDVSANKINTSTLDNQLKGSAQKFGSELRREASNVKPSSSTSNSASSTNQQAGKVATGLSAAISGAIAGTIGGAMRKNKTNVDLATGSIRGFTNAIKGAAADIRKFAASIKPASNKSKAEAAAKANIKPAPKAIGYQPPITPTYSARGYTRSFTANQGGGVKETTWFADHGKQDHRVVSVQSAGSRYSVTRQNNYPQPPSGYPTPRSYQGSPAGIREAFDKTAPKTSATPRNSLTSSPVNVFKPDWFVKTPGKSDSSGSAKTAPKPTSAPKPAKASKSTAAPKPVPAQQSAPAPKPVPAQQSAPAPKPVPAQQPAPAPKPTPAPTPQPTSSAKAGTPEAIFGAPKLENIPSHVRNDPRYQETVNRAKGITAPVAAKATFDPSGLIGRKEGFRSVDSDGQRSRLFRAAGDARSAINTTWTTQRNALLNTPSYNESVLKALDANKAARLSASNATASRRPDRFSFLDSIHGRVAAPGLPVPYGMWTERALSKDDQKKLNKVIQKNVQAGKYTDRKAASIGAKVFEHAGPGRIWRTWKATNTGKEYTVPQAPSVKPYETSLPIKGQAQYGMWTDRALTPRQQNALIADVQEMAAKANGDYTTLGSKRRLNKITKNVLGNAKGDIKPPTEEVSLRGGLSFNVPVVGMRQTGSLGSEYYGTLSARREAARRAAQRQADQAKRENSGWTGTVAASRPAQSIDPRATHLWDSLSKAQEAKPLLLANPRNYILRSPTAAQGLRVPGYVLRGQQQAAEMNKRNKAQQDVDVSRAKFAQDMAGYRSAGKASGVSEPNQWQRAWAQAAEMNKRNWEMQAKEAQALKPKPTISGGPAMSVDSRNFSIGSTFRLNKLERAIAMENAKADRYAREDAKQAALMQNLPPLTEQQARGMLPIARHVELGRNGEEKLLNPKAVEADEKRRRAAAGDKAIPYQPKVEMTRAQRAQVEDWFRDAHSDHSGDKPRIGTPEWFEQKRRERATQRAERPLRNEYEDQKRANEKEVKLTGLGISQEAGKAHAADQQRQRKESERLAATEGIRFARGRDTLNVLDTAANSGQHSYSVKGTPVAGFVSEGRGYGPYGPYGADARLKTPSHTISSGEFKQTPEMAFHGVQHFNYASVNAPGYKDGMWDSSAGTKYYESVIGRSATKEERKKIQDEQRWLRNEQRDVGFSKWIGASPKALERSLNNALRESGRAGYTVAPAFRTNAAAESIQSFKEGIRPDYSWFKNLASNKTSNDFNRFGYIENTDKYWKNQYFKFGFNTDTQVTNLKKPWIGTPSSERYLRSDGQRYSWTGQRLSDKFGSFDMQKWGNKTISSAQKFASDKLGFKRTDTAAQVGKWAVGQADILHKKFIELGRVFNETKLGGYVNGYVENLRRNFVHARAQLKRASDSFDNSKIGQSYYSKFQWKTSGLVSLTRGLGTAVKLPWQALFNPVGAGLKKGYSFLQKTASKMGITASGTFKALGTAIGFSVRTAGSMISSASGHLIRGLSTLGSGIKNVGMMAVGLITSVVTASIGVSKKAGAEETTDIVTKAVGGDAYAEAEAKGFNLRDLERSVAAGSISSVKDVQNIAGALARAGLSADELQQSLKSVNDFVIASGMDATAATRGLTGVFGAFKDKGYSMENISDLITAYSNASNTTSSEMMMGMKYAAPAAHLRGIPLENVLAELGSLADIGIRGEMGGTVLRGAYTKWEDEKAQNLRSMVANTSHKVEVGDLKKYGSGYVISEFRDGLKELGKTDEEIHQLIEDWLGLRVTNIQGLKKTAISAKQEQVANRGGAEGATGRIASAQMEGTGGMYNKIAAQFDVWLSKIGDIINKAFGPFLEAFANYDMEDVLSIITTGITNLIGMTKGLWDTIKAILNCILAYAAFLGKTVYSAVKWIGSAMLKAANWIGGIVIECINAIPGVKLLEDGETGYDKMSQITQKGVDTLVNGYNKVVNEGWDAFKSRFGAGGKEDKLSSWYYEQTRGNHEKPTDELVESINENSQQLSSTKKAYSETSKTKMADEDLALYSMTAAKSAESAQANNEALDKQLHYYEAQEKNGALDEEGKNRLAALRAAKEANDNVIKEAEAISTDAQAEMTAREERRSSINEAIAKGDERSPKIDMETDKRRQEQLDAIESGNAVYLTAEQMKEYQKDPRAFEKKWAEEHQATTNEHVWQDEQVWVHHKSGKQLSYGALSEKEAKQRGYELKTVPVENTKEQKKPVFIADEEMREVKWQRDKQKMEENALTQTQQQLQATISYGQKVAGTMSSYEVGNLGISTQLDPVKLAKQQYDIMKDIYKSLVEEFNKEHEDRTIEYN